jgi:hypothetical protein
LAHIIYELFYIFLRVILALLNPDLIRIRIRNTGRESTLISMRIRIQILISMRIRMQGAKPMRIHADPDPNPCQNLKSQKVKFLKNIRNAGTVIGQKTYLRMHTIIFERQETRFIC